MMWESRTNLYLVPREAINAEKYINEKLVTYVVPHTEFVEVNLLLMHDSARPHLFIISDYLYNANIPQMEWASHSPDLNPIEHVWDKLSRRIRGVVPAPRSLDELQRAPGGIAIPQENIVELLESISRINVFL